MEEKIYSFIVTTLVKELKIKESEINPDFLIEANLDYPHLVAVEILVELENPKFNILVDNEVIQKDITLGELMAQIMLAHKEKN